MVAKVERRFREGRGQRYMRDGVSPRCHKVSYTKLKAIRVRENRPDLTADEAWPEAQCSRPAVPGYLLCHHHLRGLAKQKMKPKDMLDWLPVDMQEKMRIIMENPQVLSRQFEMHQLIARILVLYDKLNNKEALGRRSLSHLREGLKMIHNGEVVKGADLIEEIIESRTVERETYDEIYQAMSLLKDMTRVEVSSMKDLKLMLSYDQMVAGLLGVADALSAALKEYVSDERTRELVSGAVARDIARRFNTRPGGILPAPAQAVEVTATKTE
jgi:hypothetical protein